MERFVKTRIMHMFLLTIAILFACCGEHEFGQSSGEMGGGADLTPPGVTICHYKRASRIYPSSPSICILPNGDYLAAVELGGPGCPTPKETDIYRSSDKGATWNMISAITEGQAWSNLFVVDNAVYIMGVVGPTSNIVIRKSEDNGVTWTANISEQNGLIRKGAYHTAPVPVIECNGRIWRAMEHVNPEAPAAWPKQFNAMMMSAPKDADLLDSQSWTCSSELPYNPEYLNRYFGGWLEGNAVQGPDGKVKLVMRVELPAAGTEKIAIIDVSDDGTQLSFDPETGFVDMPGGAKKFTIRYDPESRRYWTLSNYVEDKYFHMMPNYVRNVLALCSSEDLRTWTAHKKILSYPEVKYHAFQYADWQIDGDDMILVSRTAYDDQTGGADSYHNANYCTFHKVENFRDLVSETITE